MDISKRKVEHLDICLKKDVEGENYFDDVILVYNALPEVNFKEIDTRIEFMGKKLELPLIISSITGGAGEAEEINKSLAKVAERKGIGFALGSQRAMIEHPDLIKTYQVRKVAPSTLIFGNLGIANLRNISPKEVSRALKDVEADALFVHLNPAQEITQIEGDVDFKGCLHALKKLTSELRYPVIVKEVGQGISREVGIKLKGCGVKAIDVAGMGGTNWIKVEKYREGLISDELVEFGIPTTCSLLELKGLGLEVISSGGVRTGLDIAKSIAMGASVCGMALPLLKVYKEEGEEGLLNYLDWIEKELKTVMFLVGANNIEELRNARYILQGFTRNWAKQIK